MMDSPASALFDPEIESMLCTGLTGLSLVFALLIIFFAFLTVRIDNTVSWSWAVVWIPLWIINAIVAYVLLQFLLRALGHGDDDADDEDDEREDEAMHDDDESKRQQRRASRRRLRTSRHAVSFIYFILVLLFQIFIVLRLDNRVAWSAAVVFIPYFILEGLHFLLTTVLFGTALASARGQLPPPVWLQVLRLVFDQYWFFVLRLIQFVLIAVRADNTITCSWGIVFIPLYLVALKYAVQLGWSYRRFSRLTAQPEIAHQGKTTVMLGVVAFVIVGLLLYALVGLIARRLDGFNPISMSHVFVPIFIALSFLLCCFGCCLPCILALSSVSDMEDLEQGQRLVDPNRRIASS
ncbi:hypothetical protein BCR43DRAFT_365567 [Syncephalastrum racemosum]|uniref:Transmembrane protein n=1 Tax=Syncephalastrum racemosum TaxID=13706 RepID=A0A1X2H3Z9_SYNRA|nr:hypothetical protein BCR43DRAFT_365567 [Syncephalastrum racemosum]